MIALLHMPHIAADLFDDAGALMAIDGGQRAAPGAVDVMNVGVTDAAGLDLHLDVVRAGLGQLDILDHERLSELAADGGFHLTPPAEIDWARAGDGAPRGGRK